MGQGFDHRAGIAVVRLRAGQKDTSDEVPSAAPEELAPATAGEPAPRRHSGPPLGELLVDRGTISADALTDTLAEQSESGKLLGQVLIELGLLDERQLLEVLSEQLHMPIVDLRHAQPDTEALELLPESIVRDIGALPMRLTDEGLAVAMSGPPTPEQLRNLESAAKRPVSVVLAPGADIQTLIDRSYRASGGDGSAGRRVRHRRVRP